MATKVTTLGRELIRKRLPDKYKDYADRVLDKKTTTALMTAIAQEDPDGYIQVLQDLNNIGEAVVSTYGRDAALPFKDLKIDTETRNLNSQIRQLITNVLNDDSLTEEQKEEKIKQIGYKYTQKVEDAVFRSNDRRRTALASQINSGSRGNKTQLRQLQFGNMLMKDALNRDIPYVMVDPYTAGTSPMAYWVSASSGRKGFYDVQAATGQAGYLGKQVTAATHDTIISEEDCGTTDTGVPFPADSDKNIGAVLLRPFHKHPAGSVVTPEMVAEADDGEEMILRSPMTCKSKIGVCAKCNGLGENGKFPGIGEYVSLNAARSYVEPVTQMGISCLHPDTLVRMWDWSVKPIKDIAVGDIVVGVDMQGHASPTKVTHVYNHGDMPMQRYTYRKTGRTKETVELIATTEHKMLQMTYKSSCKEEVLNGIPRLLKAGYKHKRLSAVVTQSSEKHEGEQHPEALFLGLMAGDGCYTEAVIRPHFSCADPSLVEETASYLRTLGLRLTFRKGTECYWAVVNSNPVNVPGQIRPLNPASAILDKAGMKWKYAHEKTFPIGWENWCTDSVMAYIAGLIITDGSLYETEDGQRVSFGSTSLDLVKSFATAIYKHLGVPEPVRIYENKYGGRKRTLYSVVYANKAQVLTILKNVQLYGVKEPKRLEFIQKLEDAIKAEPIKWQYTRYPRVSAVDEGVFTAYDIEVEHPDHLFLLANGLVVSNSKHVGGVGGKKVEDPEGEDQPTGFRSLERMFMVPSNFPGGAVLSPIDGTVSAIKPAPQGGNYITVGQQTVYSSPDRRVTVKVGDKVTSGDTLTNGVPNPAEVVELKGLGEGRRYFNNKLNDILAKENAGTDRRNLESFTRALVSRVTITDPDGYGDYLPGEAVDYNQIAATYTPRDDAKTLPVDKATNMYLEKPVLYYSIGTRVTPAVAKELKKYQFNDVTVSEKEPPFKAKFLRPTAVLQSSQNWLPRLAGERLRDALFDAARTGVTDSYDSPSYVDKIIAAPYKP